MLPLQRQLDAVLRSMHFNYTYPITPSLHTSRRVALQSLQNTRTPLQSVHGDVPAFSLIFEADDVFLGGFFIYLPGKPGTRYYICRALKIEFAFAQWVSRCFWIPNYRSISHRKERIRACKKYAIRVILHSNFYCTTRPHLLRRGTYAYACSRSVIHSTERIRNGTAGIAA